MKIYIECKLYGKIIAILLKWINGCYERMYSNKLYQLKNDVDNIDEIISFQSDVIIMNDINPTNMKIKKSNLHEYIIINQFIFQMRS